MSDPLKTDARRWERIQELFEAGLPLPPDARRAMLARCSDDEAILAEVQTLLERSSPTGDRLVLAVEEAAHAYLQRNELAPGERIGPWRIAHRLGGGGMGAVYLASRADGEFERTVAVKVIRPELVNRPDLLLRFRKERQILADLDHPGIARMLDGGLTAAGVPYLVMEYVNGQSIVDYCREKSATLAQRLSLFLTVCEAVRYAHQHSVVHRDIKPGNILVTQDGIPKLLDFGIARLVETSADDGPETITTIAERMMTPEYASPEMLRGERVSELSDIYALGVVVYQLLAQRHPYAETGLSSWQLLQRIELGDAPAPSQVNADVLYGLPQPARERLDAIVMTAMSSSEATRYSSVDALLQDVRAYLTGRSVFARRATRLERVLKLIARNAAVTAASVDAFVHRRPRLGWAAAVMAVLLASVTIPAAFFHLREHRQIPAALRFQIEPPQNTRFTNLALSPDGRRIAAVGMQTYGSDRLWVRDVDSLKARALPGTEGIRGVPVWAPDSRHVAITTAGKLKKIDVLGGPPETICDMRTAMAGGSWSSDGRILVGALGGGLHQVSLPGTCAPLTSLDSSRQETIHGFPVLLPDGQNYVYVIRASPEQSGIYIGSLQANPVARPRRILAGATWVGLPGYESGRVNRILFVRDGTLFAQRLDLNKLEPVGEPAVITSGLAPNLSPASASANGVIVWQNQAGPRQLVWMDRQGTVLSTVGAAALYNRLALSPAGQQLAVQIGPDLAPSNIWVLEFQRGISERLTFDSQIDLDPIWLPDGHAFIFASNRSGRFDLFRKLIDAAGPDELVFESAANKYPTDVSPDGRSLIYTQVGSTTADDLWVYPLTGTGKPELFAGTEFAERLGVFSPDGRAVAYISEESGRFEVYVRPFPNSASQRKRVVSTGGGTQPHWDPDGKSLYFIAPDGTMMQATVEVNPEFRAGVPKPLFETHLWSAGGVTNGYRWAISPDGRRFLINKATNPVTETITVLVNSPGFVH